MLRTVERPAAVLFDLDNTLYAYEPSHRAALTAVESKLSRLFGIDHRSFHEAFSRAKREVKSRLGNTAGSHSRLLYFQRLIELLGLKTQPLLSLDLEQTYWRTFLGSSKLFDGVIELLDELQLAGIPRAIVTDLTAQIQFRKLVFFRLEGAFDAIVSSEETGIEKPAPINFEFALQKLGVTSGTIWMIGDDVQKDMRGAKEAVNAVTFLRLDQSIVPRRTPEWTDASFVDFDTVIDTLKRAVGGAAASASFHFGKTGNF